MDVAEVAAYGSLCLLQGGLVAVPVAPPGRVRAGRVAAALPAAMLAAGVGIAVGVSNGARLEAWLGWVATPVLAGASGAALRGGRIAATAALSAALFLVAWQVPGVAGQVAAALLIGLACVGLAGGAARLAPPASLRLGLVALVALDLILVWGTRQVGPTATALTAVHRPELSLPLLPARQLPSLQEVDLGPVQMGWLDLLAPALLGAVLVGRRLAPAAATTVAACVWGALLVVTSPVPATAPVIAGLVAGRLGGTLPAPDGKMLPPATERRPP
jgi:hypothetical protein